MSLAKCRWCGKTIPAARRRYAGAPGYRYFCTDHHAIRFADESIHLYENRRADMNTWVGFTRTDVPHSSGALRKG